MEFPRMLMPLIVEHVQFTIRSTCMSHLSVGVRWMPRYQSDVVTVVMHWLLP
jgi:hypothetical protein